MENNKLTYQTAKRLRGEKLRDIFADQLIMGEGYGKGIKNSVSLKLRAKMTGIKEKFDPLNIVKFLTFGSRLGPAILGKMMGRSRRDIEYFTGRARPVTTRETKVGMMHSLGGEGMGTSAGVQVVLNDILTFLQKSHEDDMILREKENNLREGAKLEDEKRHKKLLKALGGATATPVKVKKTTGNNQPSLFGGLMDTINSFMDKYGPMLAEIGSFMKGALWPILRLGLGNLGIFLIPVIAGTLFKMWFDEFRGNQAKKNVEVAQEKGGDVAADAEKTMNKLRDEGNYVDAFGNYTEETLAAGEQRDDAIARRDYYREDFLKHSGFRRKNNWFGKGFKYVDGKGNEPSAEMMKAANQFAEEETQKIFTGENKDPLNKFKMAKPVEKKTEPAKPADTKAKDVSSKTKAASVPEVKTTPVVAPASAAVTTKTSENVKLNMQATVPAKTEVAEKTTNNYAHSTQEQIRHPIIPSVRNMEESYQQMIWGSTRVI